jgi:hypothetical protein
MTYKIIVQFNREESSDRDMIESLGKVFNDVSARQLLADELQLAYDYLGMGGSFQFIDTGAETSRKPEPNEPTLDVLPGHAAPGEN